MSILKENKNESEVMNKKKVSILKEKFESYGQNSENIMVKCRSDILKNCSGKFRQQRSEKTEKGHAPSQNGHPPPLAGVRKGGRQEEKGKMLNVHSKEINSSYLISGNDVQGRNLMI